MTVRQGKRLMMIAAILVAVAAALNLVVAFRHHGAGDFFEAAPLLVFLALLATLWRRYARLEAEHGPDYVAPTTRARPLLVGLAVVAAVLGAVAGYLIARR